MASLYFAPRRGSFLICCKHPQHTHAYGVPQFACAMSVHQKCLLIHGNSNCCDTFICFISFRGYCTVQKSRAREKMTLCHQPGFWIPSIFTYPNCDSICCYHFGRWGTLMLQISCDSSSIFQCNIYQSCMIFCPLHILLWKCNTSKQHLNNINSSFANHNARKREKGGKEDLYIYVYIYKVWGETGERKIPFLLMPLFIVVTS